MKSAQDFTAIMQSIREDFYKGHIQEREARQTLQDVMRDFGILDKDEFLTELPVNFRTNEGWMGPFRVRHKDSAFTWSRSYGLPQNESRIGDVEIAAEPPVSPLSDADKKFFASLEAQMKPYIGFEKPPFTTEI